MHDDLGREPHSARYFDAGRNFWWNDDFIRLLGARWDSSLISQVLDVGCGMGHWGRTLAGALPRSAAVVGVDREPSWIERATNVAKDAGLGDRFSYRVADAHSLPFEDAAFDLVTCQTVLIHVPDVASVLTEMLRVLRPGGLLVLAEPNNLAGRALMGNSSLRARKSDWLKLMDLQLTCEHGKAALGLGDNSVGDLLPGVLQTLGTTDIHVYLSDKCSKLVPPYDGEEQAANVGAMLASEGEDVWIWPRLEALRYFIAGGGRESDFEALWLLAQADVAETMMGLKTQRLHAAGGSAMYVIDARKPSPV